jgi:4-hydroxybenzoate polyprenyltransferase
LHNRPLVVDLDGTLLRTDLLHESLVKLLRNRPGSALMSVLELRGGKAPFKQYVAERTELLPETLPYNNELLQWLREERSQGRQLILCTASDQRFARQVADYLDIFDDVMASDGAINLGGQEKARALRERFGRGQFDYAGNSAADLPIWECAAEAVVVSASDSLTRQAADCCNVQRCIPAPPVTAKDWLRALRVQQWLKNLLLFAPLLAAHRLIEPSAGWIMLLAFMAFSLSASATYLMNDLLDLDSDRLHPRKRKRPLAAGVISIPVGVMAAMLLLATGLLLASLVNVSFIGWLVGYLFLTCAYSWCLKRFVLLDCLSLAMLYTLRIVAGAAAINMGLSFWLLAFSAFLFLSLAFVKRYAELEVLLLEGHERAHGRGYLTSDAPLLQTLGVSSGLVSALVLSLYLNSEEVLLLYATPEIVWGAVLVLLYWISWMWMQAHRGLMHDDPLVFAIKSPASVLAGCIFLLVLFMGTVSWPW